MVNRILCGGIQERLLEAVKKLGLRQNMSVLYLGNSLACTWIKLGKSRIGIIGVLMVS